MVLLWCFAFSLYFPPLVLRAEGQLQYVSPMTVLPEQHASLHLFTHFPGTPPPLCVCRQVVSVQHMRHLTAIAKMYASSSFVGGCLTSVHYVLASYSDVAANSAQLIVGNLYVYNRTAKDAGGIVRDTATLQQ